MIATSKKNFNPLLTIWSLIRNVGYLFIIFILAFILFNVPDQSKDFIYAFIDGSEPTYYIWVFILLFFWSSITWYSASVILEISPVNAEFVDEAIANNFCLFIGCIPAVLMALTFFIADAKMLGSFCLLAGILFTLLFKSLDKLNGNRGMWPGKDDILRHNYNEKGQERTPSFGEEIKFIKNYTRVIFYFKWLGFFFIILLGLLCFPQILIPFTRLLRPASVILLILSFITYVFTVLFYFHDIKKRPFVFVILIWMIGWSTCNDNTKIPITKNFKNLADFRLTPNAAFEKWYNFKIGEWKNTHDSTVAMPVIFIATQGGGVRGELWTSEVLHILEDSLKITKTSKGNSFYNQIFCIGGASGGTVGAVYYNAFIYDSLKNHNVDTSLTFKNFQEFATADCISPVTASFAFGENLQRLLPFPVASLDRSKIMMSAFSTSYKTHLKSSFVDSSLLSMYYPNDDTNKFNCHIPSLFINGELAETGQRTITSNLKLAGSKNFDDDVDFFNVVKGHISISTASLNCMRFPLLISGGLFQNGANGVKSRPVGHVVDGGYRENTGLQAMYSLICELREKLKQYKIKPILLYLRNGGIEYNSTNAESKHAIRVLHDIGTPVVALINVNGTSLPALGTMKMIEQQQGNDFPLHTYYNQIWLNNPDYGSEGHFPLGLYISDFATTKLRKRASQMTRINHVLMDTLKNYFK